MTVLQPQRANEYHELLLLRAEIAIARNHLKRATQSVADAMAALHKNAKSGASYQELLGRTHIVSARLRHRAGGQANKAAAIADAEYAMKIFDRLGLRHWVDLCRWFLITVEPATARVTRWDVAVLARLTPDHRIRLRAVEERQRRVSQAVQARWWKPAEWRDIVRWVRT